MAYNKTPNSEASELIEKVVYLNRVSKTVKGGRVMKFSALVVVGDGKGTVGYGLGKAAEVSEAILKGIADAKKNMVKVSLAQMKNLSGIRLYEMNSKITVLREMERDTRIIGKQLTSYYDISGEKRQYCRHKNIYE